MLFKGMIDVYVLHSSFSFMIMNYTCDRVNTKYQLHVRINRIYIVRGQM